MVRNGWPIGGPQGGRRKLWQWSSRSGMEVKWVQKKKRVREISKMPRLLAGRWSSC